MCEVVYRNNLVRVCRIVSATFALLSMRCVVSVFAFYGVSLRGASSGWERAGILRPGRSAPWRGPPFLIYLDVRDGLSSTGGGFSRPRPNGSRMEACRK